MIQKVCAAFVGMRARARARALTYTHTNVGIPAFTSADYSMGSFQGVYSAADAEVCRRMLTYSAAFYSMLFHTVPSQRVSQLHMVLFKKNILDF